MTETDGLLIVAAFLTSVVSGFMSLAGGMMLLTIMAEFFPPALLIPLHGVVQFGSNLSRTILLYSSIHKRSWLLFGGGVLLGATLGSQVVVSLPEKEFRIIIGVFILVMTWLPKIKFAPRVSGAFFYLGSFASFISLFVGATGPFIAPFFLRRGFSKEAIVATKAACQAVVHFGKVVVFVALGFSFAPFWKLLAGMLIASFLGNLIGKRFLAKISQSQFLWLFRLLLSALALRLLYKACQL